MKGVYEAMKKIISNPIFTFVAIVLSIMATGMFTSASSGADYKKAIIEFVEKTNTEAIKSVINEVITPRLDSIDDNMMSIDKRVGNLEKGVNTLNEGTWQDHVKDINKYYEKYKKGDIQDFTKTNFEAMTGWWKDLADRYKDDALINRYNILVEYYSKIY